jgi:uncharacterized repeat protein (TIGR01451 family)
VREAIVNQLVARPAALSVAKSGSPRVAAGGTAVFVIRVRNRSRATVRRLVATDTPPTGATALSVSGAEITSSGGVVWTRPGLAPGRAWTLTVRLRVPAGAKGRLVNRVTVISRNAVPVQSRDPFRVVPSKVSVTG